MGVVWGKRLDRREGRIFAGCRPGSALGASDVVGTFRGCLPQEGVDTNLMVQAWLSLLPLPGKLLE